MAEIGGVGGNRPLPTDNQNASGKVTSAGASGAGSQAFSPDAPVGPAGPLGQPTGMPAPVAPGQKLLPDVIAGRDPSQLVAAERLRATGGASATEELLGLNRQPTMAGAFAAPPGNSEALRHITPAMRRTVMRGLLDKQRGRMRALALAVRREGGQREEDDGGSPEEQPRERFMDELLKEFSDVGEAQLARASQELKSAAQMLDLLEELLAMQDYTISQMGTFTQG